ncbi:MAG: type I-E CRISPR-associated protein Cas7/Cse4/CasC [Gammaproteobacteria bacterium]
MRLIEVHILQSFPVSCLNRDDVGAPKTAIFGGAVRARISSQCLKRAIRNCAKDMLPALNQGIRSRYILPLLAQALEKQKVKTDRAEKLARDIAAFFNEIDKKDERRVKTAMFLSPREIAEIAKALAEIARKKDPTAADIKKASKSASRIDAADIAIFGRMVANDSSVSIEGAGMFSHALSTHKAENDIDFFSAVDEAKPEDVPAGAAITDTLEFTSATYYRYAGLNLDLLADETHLGALSARDRKSVVDAFLRAAVLAVPGARKNSMNAHTLPGYVLGLVKDKGQPLQLINAFETPVFSKNGLMDASVTALKKHHEELKKTWGIKPAAEVAIPEKSLDELCKEILRHVA